MVVCDVRPDQQNKIGLGQVVIASGRTVAAEGSLVARDGAGHAQSGVAVEVVGAEPELYQLAKRVELFGYQLAGADHGEGIRAVPLLDGADTRDHGIERFTPAHTPVVQHGIERTARSSQSVMFG